MVETYKNDKGQIGVLVYTDCGYAWGEMFNLDECIQSRYDSRVIKLWLRTHYSDFVDYEEMAQYFRNIGYDIWDEDDLKMTWHNLSLKWVEPNVPFCITNCGYGECIETKNVLILE